MSNHKNFPITAWAVNNRTTVYVLTVLIFIIGAVVYVRLPKEQFPDVVVPTILVTTINAGTAPVDMENLVTRQIEKQIKSVADVKKVLSQSIQDASIITVEFTTEITPTVAKQRVTDAIDRAKANLPVSLTKGPDVQEIDMSEFPIMFVNISGDIGLDNLKVYADELQDKIESLHEIRRVDIIGALEKEIRIDLDPYRMQSLGVSFHDVSSVLSGENVNISAGDLNVGGIRRNVKVSGEYRTVDDIKETVVKSGMGNLVYLRDIATVIDTAKEQQSFARLDGHPVVTLSVLKKSGENLIDASDKIQMIIADYQAQRLPDGVTLKLTNDMSKATRSNIADLVNSIVIGFLLVTTVLMFFMGVSNSLFIGLATPLSSFLAFMVMPGLDFTFNIVVTFSFLLALGIIVDDAIVVIENTHRLHVKEGYDVKTAAGYAAAEVFAPVFAGTLTTLAPFFPLLFWPGIVGEFMVYLPSVLIITLTASLIVAYIINPVFAVDFMDRKKGAMNKRVMWVLLGVVCLAMIAALLAGAFWFAVLAILVLAFITLNKFVLSPYLIEPFQEKILPGLMGWYRSFLRFMLAGKRPAVLLVSVIVLFVATIVFAALYGKPPVFFPSGEPNYGYIYIQLPIGTDAVVTDSVTKVVEQRVRKIIGPDNPDITAIVSNVGLGAGDPRSPDRTVAPNKGKVSVAFEEYAKRRDPQTSKYLTEFRKAVADIPGAEIIVEKEANGPPTGKEISIEIAGDDFAVLEQLTERVRALVIDSLHIPGIEKLKSDLERNKPEISVVVDRARANIDGITSSQIGFTLRGALHGLEATKMRVGEDEYPLQIRVSEDMRSNIDAMMNLPVTYRDMSTGAFRQVPISSLATINYVSSFSGIHRKNQQRVVTLASNVLQGYNATAINAQIAKALKTVRVPDGYSIRQTGAQEEQADNADFLGMAFGIAAGIIILILVIQFNSLAKPVLIMSTVLFSVIGVLLGFTLFGIEFSIVITGVGIIALGGIVVRNGIVLVDFTDILLAQGVELREAIVEGGAIRFNPVVLTAASTILGLVPLAIGLNFDFWAMLNLRDPHFHVGSDSVAFWGPLAWAVIFGLLFATFLTLIVVPCLYLLQIQTATKLRKFFSHS
ncbi:MAG: copper transporter [Ignavibacteria bacterium]